MAATSEMPGSEIPMSQQREQAYSGQLMAKQWSLDDPMVDKIARVCHEANRAVCVCNGDISQPGWEDAPEWQKESARKGVVFHIHNPLADGKRSHDEWMEVKLRAGWRYGAIKNVETKEHPCLLPYHALPDNEKVKDDIFRNVVRAYVEAVFRNNIY
jgi:hypothetical protein